MFAKLIAKLRWRLRNPIGKESDAWAEALEMIVNTAQDGLVLQDEFGHIKWCNPSYCKMTGWSLEEMVGRKPQSFLMPPESKLSDEYIAAFRYSDDFKYLDEFEVVRNVKKNGELFWNQLSFGMIEQQNGRRYYVIISRDISSEIEQKEALEQAQQRLETIANTDSLTGLANRLRFETELSQSLRRCDTGVLNIDLDGFKEINDVHGHAAGDATLVHVAQSLKSLALPTDLVARIGGDEFTILSRNQDQSGMEALGQRILTASKSWKLDWHGTPLHVGASLGAVAEAKGSCSANELLRRSDIALYTAKNAGKGRLSFYDFRMHKSMLAARKTLAELRQSIVDGAFEMHLQPICRSHDRQVIGFENLLRWRPASGEIIGPDGFLNLARQHGLMVELDCLAMQLAVRSKATLAKAGLGNLFCSFNVGPEALNSPTYVDRLISECQSYCVSPQQMTIEIHETTVIGGPDSRAAQTVERLSNVGFRVALDDFGAGSTGLAKLASMNIHSVKLDRSLVAGLPDDLTAGSVMRALCSLCTDMNLFLIVEGVETVAQLDLAKEFGCTMAQGYLFSKPIPIEDAITFANSNVCELNHLSESLPPAGGAAVQGDVYCK
jgi:diguanylate cyclase (GGDEF)-like protein/PAS domain S-box-containing protein